MARQNQAGRSQRGRFGVSLIVGMLLIPVSAVAAYGLMSRSGGETEQAASAAGGVAGIEAFAAQQPAGSTAATDPSSSIDADLQSACGDDGRSLVDLEASGQITDVQQAALDSLREVCADVGMPLDEGDDTGQTAAGQKASASRAAPGTTSTTVEQSTTATTFSDDSRDEHHDDEYEHEDEHEAEHGDD